jgi:hypothetical protein
VCGRGARCLEAHWAAWNSVLPFSPVAPPHYSHRNCAHSAPLLPHCYPAASVCVVPSQLTDARNVVVVVSRWYGGILLGPARFTHINNAARDLLDTCGYISRGSGKQKKGVQAKKK